MDGTILEKKLKLAEKLKQLDEIAQQIEDMPTFTSDDRAFLEDLPAYPSEDGTKVLTATTNDGETVLSYEIPASGSSIIMEKVQLASAQTINGQFQIQVPIDKVGYTPLGIVGYTMNNRADINITGVYISENEGVYNANVIGISTNQSVQPSVDVLYIENVESVAVTRKSSKKKTK